MVVTLTGQSVSIHNFTCMGHGADHKNNSVSGRPAGWLKKVRLETFFFIFAKKNFFFQNWTIFAWEKKLSGKKKKFAAARLASIVATRCTGNRIFFMVSLGAKLILWVIFYRLHLIEGWGEKEPLWSCMHLSRGMKSKVHVRQSSLEKGKCATLG